MRDARAAKWIAVLRPVVIQVLSIADRKHGFQQCVFTIVIIDTLQAIFRLVNPGNLARVTGIGIRRDAFEYEAQFPVDRFVTQVFVAVFLNLLRGEIFVGELTTHEGTGFIR